MLQELSSSSIWDGEQLMHFLPLAGQNQHHSSHLLRMGEDSKAGRKELACRGVCTADHCSLTGYSGPQLEPMKRSEHGVPFLGCLLWDVALFFPISHRKTLGGAAHTEPSLARPTVTLFLGDWFSFFLRDYTVTSQLRWLPQTSLQIPMQATHRQNLGDRVR